MPENPTNQDPRHLQEPSPLLEPEAKISGHKKCEIGLKARGSVVICEIMTDGKDPFSLDQEFHQLEIHEFHTETDSLTFMIGKFGSANYFLRYDPENNTVVPTEWHFQDIDYDPELQLFVGQNGSQRRIIVMEQGDVRFSPDYHEITRTGDTIKVKVGSTVEYLNWRDYNPLQLTKGRVEVIDADRVRKENIKLEMR